MKAKIVQFRRSKYRIHERHYILDVNAKSKEEAGKFKGKEVIWISSGKQKKEIKGKISGSHGNKGLVRAIFEKGLPGQAINDEIEVEPQRLKISDPSTKLKSLKKISKGE